MDNIMLDLETMGTSFNAAIMAIGACYFDPRTGDIGDTFYTPIDISTNGNIDASTVIWWMQQSEDARSKFFDNDKAPSLEVALHGFSAFVGVKGRQVWGNGIAFDNVILKNAYGSNCPWDFWNDRDVRTMVELGKVVGINPKTDMPFKGTKHDALADAIHQAKYVSLIYKTILLDN